MKTFPKTLYLFIALMSSTMFFAQDYAFKDYEWDEKAKKIEIPERYKNENEVILKRVIKTELSVIDNKAMQFHLIHDQTYINSDDAIERNNRIYIPFSQKESVITTKARVILQNGKIIHLDKKDIKEETDEERGVKYNYFAVNGLEKGAVIEVMYVLREMPELDGETIKMQDEYPIADLDFELIYPEHLGFKTKSYNGLPEPVKDEAKYKGKISLSVKVKDIAALNDEEKYSNREVMLKMLRYKLDENLYNNSRNLYNYKEFATNIYERFNAELTKKEQKSIDDFCKSIPKSDDPQEQVWNIENKIKKTITYNRFIETKETISEIIASKQANQTDILKLYLNVFRKFGIENNMVFTLSRYKLPFDPDFESYENLNDMLFYFPAIKKYITPTEIEFRMPLFPPSLGNNNGLFIKSKTFGGVSMGIGEVGFIELPGADVTHDVMDITVDFTADMDSPVISDRIDFGGYAAHNFQPIKDFASAEQYQSILKSVAENYTVDAEYKTLKSENDGTEFIGKKPFTLLVSFDGKDLIQKAGPNYLFSAGLVIGRQMELYQEDKRTLPVEIDYPHSYTRKIHLLLPKGATVQNLEKFNMDYKTVINGKTEAAFTSKYTQKGDEILIENTEYYNIINYPLDKFEEYRAVINAAADFNKVVIVLSK
ncbi:DUF3857 domain-containing protein [Flavobacterium pallidum]|uniref:DUF3857 domain-containing protein n=1 Tax=Flavobacterium pallidum TaxID=2172098 RepID=A0A2S1SHY7_9FLAO|nr:DUF3857 domain-containing protein [Flavobacterium pallidum]AWI26026.1 hypothetical protein HYN49_09025 [Flavobacterium pallidum]